MLSPLITSAFRRQIGTKTWVDLVATWCKLKDASPDEKMHALAGHVMEAGYVRRVCHPSKGNYEVGARGWGIGCQRAPGGHHLSVLKAHEQHQCSRCH